MVSTAFGRLWILPLSLIIFLQSYEAFRSEMNLSKGSGDWWIHWDAMKSWDFGCGGGMRMLPCQKQAGRAFLIPNSQQGINDFTDLKP